MVSEDLVGEMKRRETRVMQLSPAELAKKLAERLRNVNSADVKVGSLHLLLGILDSLADGRSPPSSNIVVELALECSRNSLVVFPPDVSYLIGRTGFGLFAKERSSGGMAL